MSDCSGGFRTFVEASVSGILGAVWGVKTTGLDLVPRSGPLIVAGNHSGLLDGPLLGATIAPARRPNFLGKKELFDNPLLAAFLRGTGVIPLDRGAGDLHALRAALEALSSGGSVILFPEGTRVKAGEKRAPKLGVSFLSAKTGAPVVPVRLTGSGEFPFRFPLEVRFGSPLAPPPEGREAASSFARAVMDAIYAL